MMPASSTDSSRAFLKYRFRDDNLLEEALTHKSYVNERREPGRTHNERLEFLGDAVLSLIISDYLAGRYSELSEGALSKLKAGSWALSEAWSRGGTVQRKGQSVIIG
jgi:ribonuclease-3